jgi:recombination protein RecA
MERRVSQSSKPASGYFTKEKTDIEFIPSGCRLLDCVLGGGWALGRVANIVGDKSSGKTLLAIEAMSNMAKTYPKARICYRETESAFEKNYAAALGLPLSKVDFGKKGQFETVEDLFEDLTGELERLENSNRPGLYILDSLDALSDREEMKRKIDKGSFGLEKQKLIGRLFRQKVRKIESARICFFVINQVRDKIGVMFGDKYTRTGGKALDFYASQALWLSHIAQITEEFRGQKRVTGVRIKAKAKKNKIGLAHRECEFVIRFGFGIDDLQASVEFLHNVKRLSVLTKEKPGDFLTDMDEATDAEYTSMVQQAGDLAEQEWRTIERSFLPNRSKY